MRDDHNATTLTLRWSAVLGNWFVCDPTDRGAVKFVRAEPTVIKPAERYWNVTLDGKIIGDHLGQHGMLTVCVFAATVPEAERIALEQAAESATELKVLFTRPS